MLRSPAQPAARAPPLRWRRDDHGDRARPPREGRGPPATAVAPHGLGELAAPSSRAGRRGCLVGRAGGLAVDRRTSAAPRVCGRSFLSPLELKYLPEPDRQLPEYERHSEGWLRPAGPA